MREEKQMRIYTRRNIGVLRKWKFFDETTGVDLVLIQWLKRGRGNGSNKGQNDYQQYINRYSIK